MTKYKKLGSLVLAGCMAASSLAMSAGAVNVAPEETTAESQALSEFAGETIKCKVVTIETDGTSSEKVVDVAIPEGVTSEQAKDIIALSTDTGSNEGISTFSAYSPYTQLGSTNYNAYIPLQSSSTGNAVFPTTTITKNCMGLKVVLANIQPNVGNLNVRVRNAAMVGTNAYDPYYLNASTDTSSSGEISCTVFFWNGVDLGQEGTGNGVPSFHKGNRITVYASATRTSGKADVSVYMGNAYD